MLSNASALSKTYKRSCDSKKKHNEITIRKRERVLLILGNSFLSIYIFVDFSRALLYFNASIY